MWLILCSMISSMARSASSWLMLPRAAAPKMIRVLSWPVLPNGSVGSMGAILPPALSAPPLGQQDRDQPVGPGLVDGVVGVRGDRPIPPGLALLALQFAGRGIEKIRAVLDHQGVGI